MDVLRGLQEGWMEMPELFGNAYILPVVIVVVLLLALLLILMIKRRRGASPRDVRPVERVATPRPGPAPTETPQKLDTSTAPADEPAEATAQAATTAQAAVAAQPAAAAQPPAPDKPPPVIPVTRASGAPEQTAPTDDPLKAVIVDIVHGWGELTSEDTNRLDLFRPDKVLAVAETIELPKEDAGGGYARSRLLEIRKYAADKQVKHEPSEQVSPPASEPVAETEPVPTDGFETSRPEVPEFHTPGIREKPRRPIWEPPRPDGAAAGVGPAGAGLAAAGLAGAGLAAVAGADTEDGEQIEDRQSLERALGDDESEWSAPEPIAPSPWIEESQPDGSAAPSPWPEASQAAELRPAQPDMPSPWSEAPAGWDVQEPAVLEEVPLQPDSETPLVGTEAVGTIEAVAVTGAVETGGAQEPPPVEEPPFAEEPPHVEEPPPVEDMTARVQASDDSLSSLHVRVRTADELMALPPQERADMLAFLEPPELARVIQTSDDRALKKSVIDVLENLGNPASLDVLRRCLDDPDQEIQLYALDAADRLLGVE